MKKSLTVLACAICAIADAADDVPHFDKSGVSDDTLVVGFICEKSRNALEVGYFTGYKARTESMELWDTWDLKINKTAVEAVQAVREVERSCIIGGDQYVVRIRGVPGNWNLNGECGGLTYAGAKILKNGKVIFDEDFEVCRSESIVSKIKITPGTDAPTVTRVTHKDFYGAF